MLAPILTIPIAPIHSPPAAQGKETLLKMAGEGIIFWKSFLRHTPRMQVVGQFLQCSIFNFTAVIRSRLTG
jgi:hypothetical protein